jgi:uncharacterized protein YpmB
METSDWISIAAVIVAAIAVGIAFKSWQVAVRSAKAAEDSVEIQRQQASAAAADRRDAKRADIVAHSWESSNLASHQGLNV